MNRSRVLTIAISAALLVGAVSCKTSSPKTADEEPASAEATQGMEESDGEVTEELAEAETEESEAETEESEAETEKRSADSIRTVGVVDENGATVELPTHVPVVPGKVSVDGELEGSAVRRVMRRYRREIQFCYTQSLEEQPDAGGEAVVESVVAADGSVESAEIAEAELPKTGLGECVVSKMERWRYPETADGKSATVRIPWYFNPSDESDSD